MVWYGKEPRALSRAKYAIHFFIKKKIIQTNLLSVHFCNNLIDVIIARQKFVLVNKEKKMTNRIGTSRVTSLTSAYQSNF